jgi:hypothetical protein
MKKICLVLVLACFAFLTACGYNNNSSTSGGGGSGGGFTPQGNFSVASLSGQYAYQLSGAILANGFPPFAESGVFTADGKGGVTNGTDDQTPSSPVSTNTFTGTYTMANDGTGFLTLQFTGGSIQFAITMVKSSKFYLTKVDGTANASGFGEQQTTSAITSVPNGTFAFRIHNENTLQGPIAQVGAFTINNGAVTGNEDVLISSGSVSSESLTGSFNAPTGSGRGTGTLVDTTGTLSFQYYIVDANTIDIMPSALAAVSITGLGRAEAQTGGPFSQSSLSAGYAFGSHGDTAANLGGSQTAGRFTASNGAISSGLEDFVVDGVSGSKDAFTGNYTMATNGRAAVTFTSSSLGTVSEVFWMVSPTRAFFLEDSSAKVEDGTLDAQTASTFSNSSLSGQSAFTMSGFNSSVLDDRLGTLIWDGAGNLTANLVEVDTGSGTSGVVTSTYAVDPDNSGRASTSLAGLPSSTANTDLVFYLTSGSTGYMLQNDGNTEIGGSMVLQSQ